MAEPIRVDAERRAVSEIRNLDPSDPWSEMRAVATRKLVYVAPVKRRVRRPSSRRPNLADLLMKRAMKPALDAHIEEVVDGFDMFLKRLEHDWQSV